MFEDSLIESAGKIKTKTRYTTMVSVAVQVLMIGVMILIPLIYTEALPKGQLTTFLVAPPPPPPPPPPAAAVEVKVVKKIETEIVDGQLRTPTKIPDKVKMIQEDEAPPPSSASTGVPGGVPGGIPGGQMGGVIGGIVSSTPVAVPRVEAPKKVRVSSGVIAGQRIDSTRPQYPALAKSARIQGTVQLAASISRKGVIENLRVLSGHPMLVQAALDAAKNFRYRPYILNGEPVEVETTIAVNFTLTGG